MNGLQTELADFVNRTRRRLQSIAETIVDCSADVPRNQQQTTAIASETTPAREPQQTTDHPLPTIDAATSQEPPTPSLPIPEIEPAVDENDPLERLSAIKIRLAKQIESSR
ncbi:hypothetical protein [Rubripirellula lacrimiformis]|nr:hypothetical protein [Rubripirellula lacrimiformis]